MVDRDSGNARHCVGKKWFVTYVDRITDIWGFGAFICQLIAILELAYGMRIAMLAQSRKKSYRLTPEERHEYAQYLYEKQYQRYPAVANQMLLVMARMSILLDNYERLHRSWKIFV